MDIFVYNTIVKTGCTQCNVLRFALNLKISKPLTRKTIVLKLSLLTENLHWSSTLIKIHGNGAFLNKAQLFVGKRPKH